jgi:hypothetical protein
MALSGKRFIFQFHKVVFLSLLRMHGNGHYCLRRWRIDDELVANRMMTTAGALDLVAFGIDARGNA